MIGYFSRIHGFVKSSRENQMSNNDYQVHATDLSNETRDMHNAIISLQEELEAIDNYNQRADVCKNKELKSIIEHNRDEEKEHAAMLMEWIRRNDQRFSGELKKYLFTEKIIEQQ
jgi:hypothetical protein